MADRGMRIRAFSFFDRWVRTGNALYVASLVAILTSVGVFLAIGGRNAVAGSAVCITAVFAAKAYHARRIEKMRRGKEILAAIAASAALAGVYKLRGSLL
jgi:hypothetical protein